MLTTIQEDGLVPIPEKIREQMGLRAGEKVEVDYSDNRLIIRRPESTEDRIKHAQALVADRIKPGSRSLANELIAERREEAHREAAQ